MTRTLGWATLLATSLVVSSAAAGDFDELGNFEPASDAVVYLDFGEGFDPEETRYVPDDVEDQCLGEGFTVVDAPDALAAGKALVVEAYHSFNAFTFCAERFLVELPPDKGSYTATIWMRHGDLDARIVAVYPEEDGRPDMSARMAPTGRTTSDGWVELASNAFSVDAEAAEAVYLYVRDADEWGTEVDALEIRPASEPYLEDATCTGLKDPVCGPDRVCVHQRCQLGRLGVPPLPDVAIRDAMVDMMQSQLRMSYGGRKTRLSDMPKSLAQLDAIRGASTAWAFWNGWGKAWRLLHDWHTSASNRLESDRNKRLNLCFFEGDADLSQAVYPKHPVFQDILVSHRGDEGNHGIAQGDRLVAVDGMHPIAWSLTLRDVDWGWWQANDDNVFAESAERMRSNIVRYATTFSILHCDAATDQCDPVPEVFVVADLPDGGGGQVRCDNRPFYHLQDNPGPNHAVGGSFFKGQLDESTDQEAIYGLVWDTLSGSTNFEVNVNNAYDDFKALARGVVLDHRAGNGGTVQGAELITTLVRPPLKMLVLASPALYGAWDGPETPAEGLVLFNQFNSTFSSMTAGSTSWDPDMPVALLTHRDGSASDFMPFGMKGAPNVRIFGPGPTAGAFSTFYDLDYWGGLFVRMASGDTISLTGEPQIGKGVVPDEIILPKQSDLLDGKDTLHEAALAWLRNNLKP